MELKPTYGIDRIVFGMSENDIIRLLGNPDKISKTDDEDIFYQYNNLKIRLTFYKDENDKLGYISCSNPKITFNYKKIIGLPVSKIKSEVFDEIEDWEINRYEEEDIYFNEDVWLNLNVQYEEVTTVEIGVMINDNDQYVWKK